MSSSKNTIFYSFGEVIQLLVAFIRAGFTSADLAVMRSGRMIKHIKEGLGKKATRVFLAENPYLRIVEGCESLPIKETTGQRTMAQAKALFTGYLDPDFKNYGLDKPSKSTEAATLTLCEMHEKDGTFRQIITGAFPGVELKDLVITQDQFQAFVEEHRDKLHPKGYATFALIQDEETGEVFVALVLFGDPSYLKARVYRFSYDYEWSASCCHRFLIPELVLAPKA